MGQLIKNHEWFNDKVKEYHKDKVELLSEYNGLNNLIDIVYHCEEHGDTYTTINAKNICKGYFLPCKQCQSRNKSLKAKEGYKNKDYYLKRLQNYCISRGGKLISEEWITAKDLYEVKCGNPNHPTFWNNADSLINKPQWCPYCSGREGNFEDDINKIIKSKDGELLSKYVASRNYVRVKCNKHNYEWNILPSNIKKGRWCPICSLPFSEKVVWDYLKNNKCNVHPQYTFDDLKGDNNENLRYDFAILNDKNELVYILEVDDESHKIIYKNSVGNSGYKVKQRDIIKNKYCKDNNIQLYRMEVPFRRCKKWCYDDYYKYIHTELKFIVALSRL